MRACHAPLMLVSSALLLVLLSLCSTPATAQNSSHITYDALVSRLHAAPFSQDALNTIVASLKLSMEMYAFADLARDSSIGAPPGASFTQQNIDVRARIAELASQTFSSNFAMEDAFTQLFLSLNDAHTGFSKGGVAPSCAFMRPFRLQVRLVPLNEASRPHQQKVYMQEQEGLYQIYASVYGSSPLAHATIAGTGQPITLTSVDGWEIAFINGVDALTALWTQATDGTPLRVGLSKDPNTRLNVLSYGFTSDPAAPPGIFAYRPQSRYGIPTDKDLTLTLRNPADSTQLVNVPYQWVGVAPAEGALDFSSIPLPPLKRDFFLRTRQMEQRLWEIHSLQHAHESVVAQREALMASSPVAPVTLPSPPLSSPPSSAPPLPEPLFAIPGEIEFLVLADGTGVLRLYSFEPDSVGAFLDVVQQGITLHQQQLGGKQLFIDLRANGGGDICLGYAVLRFLFPQLALPLYAIDSAMDSPFGRYDMPTAPTTTMLADLGEANMKQFPLNNTCDFFTPCGWLRPDTQTQFVDESWYVNTSRVLQRGSLEGRQYSSLFHDACQSYFELLAPPAVNAGYAADRVAILSGGMCGSTCSVFSSFIHYNKLAKSVVLGGLVDATWEPMGQEKMQFWSFPGGQVIHLEDLQEIAAGYGVAPNDPRVPGLYMNGATQSWALREIYPWNDTTGVYPLEFMHVPSAFHVGFNTTAFDSAGIYAYLTDDYSILSPDVCVPGLAVQTCIVAHGQGARGCIAGDLQPCAAVVCDAGYHIDTESGSCAACPPGSFRTAEDDVLVCQPCTQGVNGTTFDGVDCKVRFLAEAWTQDNCPIALSCAPVDASNSGGVSKSTFIAVVASLGALAALLLVVLLVLVCRQRAALRDAQVNDHFRKMEQ